MDFNHVLHNEENDRKSPTVEQPSTSTQFPPPPPPAPRTLPPAPGLAFREWSPSSPPYGLIPDEAEATTEPQCPCEPVPPPYSVATFLPTYEEAERARAAGTAASAVPSGEPIQAEDAIFLGDHCTGLDAEQLRVCQDAIFLVTFFMAFLFNWVGFCLSFGVVSSIAGRYGALCGFGHSLTKWILIIPFSNYFTGYINGQYWLWWIFLLMGLLLFFRGFYSYLKVRKTSERLGPASRTRWIFSD
ncbi:NEDD4 family-interacting protein 2-like [Trichosurus vulpecula]|uniref:NEDD4 family-interacting protein 2-like n=1 Tax=Trichosurus vulpecula TaxID=9337 RepID=UPI00186B3F2D|nr:NEDD4 family-interacting protein 2-like [Trichosurus vulpecula]